MIMPGLIETAISVGVPVLTSLGAYFTGMVNARNTNKTTDIQKVNLQQARELEAQREVTQMNIAALHIQSQAALENQRERFQERLQMQGFQQHISLQEAQQAFQLRLNQMSYEQQAKIQEYIQSINIALHQSNLDFQRWRFEQEKALSQELAAQNRQFQFQLAEYNRKAAMDARELERILANWPLTLTPYQLLQSSSEKQAVPLRVFLSPPAVDFDRFVNISQRKEGEQRFQIEKYLSEGLREFFDQHYPVNSPHRAVEFLDGAWESKRFRGGASIKTLFEQLRTEPTLILESVIDGDYLSLRVAYWSSGAERPFYDRVISRLSCRDILNNLAKQRAKQWQIDRKQLFERGLPISKEKIEMLYGNPDAKAKRLLAFESGETNASLDEIDRLYGQENPGNFKIWQEEQRLRASGIPRKNLPRQNYQHNSDVYLEELYRAIIDYHAIVAAYIADAHYLFHQGTPPLLADVLPTLFQHKATRLIMPYLSKWLCRNFRELLEVVSLEQAYWAPDLAIQFARGMRKLPDSSIAEQTFDAVRLWLQLRDPVAAQAASLADALAAMPALMRPDDAAFIETLKTCVEKIDDPAMRANMETLSRAFDTMCAAQREAAANAAAHIQRGLQLVETGHYQDAINAFSQAVAADPSSAAAHVKRGMTLAMIGKYPDAIEDFDCALKLDPSCAEAYKRRGDVRYETQEYETAIADYTEAIRLTPNDAEAYVNRSASYSKLGEEQQVEADLQQALRILPLGADGYRVRGDAYANLKNYQAAIDDFTTALRFNWKDAEAHTERGNARFESGDHDGASEDFAAAIRLNPYYWRVYNRQGVSYYAMQDFEKAAGCFQQALAINPNNEIIRKNLSGAYMGIGDNFFTQEQYEKALEQFQEALRWSPDDDRAYNWIGIIFCRLNRYDEAVCAYQEAIRLNPNEAIYHCNLADFLEYQDRYGEAETAWREAIRLNPNEAYYSYRLGFEIAFGNKKSRMDAKEKACLHDVGLEATLNYHSIRFEKTEAAFREAIRLNSNEAKYYAALGRSLYDLENYADAEKAWREAIRLQEGEDNHDKDCYYAFINMLCEQERYREAAEIQLQSLNIFELVDVPIFVEIMTSLMTREKYEEVITICRKGIKVVPSFPKGKMGGIGGFRRFQAHTYNFLGLSLDKQGKTDEAIAAFRNGIQVLPKESGLHYNLGLELLELDRYQEAKDSLNQAKALYQTQDNIKRVQEINDVLSAL